MNDERDENVIHDETQERVSSNVETEQKLAQIVEQQTPKVVSETNDGVKTIEYQPDEAISPTFARLVNEVRSDISEEQPVPVQEVLTPTTAPKAVTPAPKEVTVPKKKSIFDDIDIDLNNIKVASKADKFAISSSTSELLENKATKNVICCQSGYAAQLSALKNQEIQNLVNSDVTYYQNRQKLFKTIHDHLEGTSVGKINLNTFLKITSFFDIETLLYGIFCQTFPYENKYSIRCSRPSCGKEFDIIVNNESLIETRGSEEEIYQTITDIVRNVTDARDLVQHSLVHTEKKVLLDETKIIFTITIPSLYEYLEEILGQINDRIVDEFAMSLGTAMFIKEMLVPDINRFRATGELEYLPITNKMELVRYIGELPYYDAIQLSEAINDFTDRLRVTYSIKNVTCPFCANEMDNIELEMERVLFTIIRQGKR